MKTIDELYNEVIASEELRKEFCTLKPEEVKSFAAKHGCAASPEEIKAFLTAKSAKSGELSDDEIKQAAGGKSISMSEMLWSIDTLGIACAVMAYTSAVDGNCGTAIEGEGMLCDAF